MSCAQCGSSRSKSKILAFEVTENTSDRCLLGTLLTTGKDGQVKDIFNVGVSQHSGSTQVLFKSCERFIGKIRIVEQLFS